MYMQVNCTLPITCIGSINESTGVIRSYRRHDRSPTVEARQKPAFFPSRALNSFDPVCYSLPLNEGRCRVDSLTPLAYLVRDTWWCHPAA
jgi:hypothetical protein